MELSCVEVRKLKKVKSKNAFQVIVKLATAKFHEKRLLGLLHWRQPKERPNTCSQLYNSTSRLRSGVVSYGTDVSDKPTASFVIDLHW